MAYVEVGGSPHEEDCAQTGSRQYDYVEMNRIECRMYIKALEKKLGPPPEGCFFRVRANAHDFGTYLEAVFHYPDDSREGSEYATKAENGLAKWADVGWWAPVWYVERRVVNVIDDDALLDREKNPKGWNKQRFEAEQVPLPA